MTPRAEGAVAARAPRPWKRAIAWLACLGPFFYLSYGFANAMAGRRADVPSIVFDWEHAVPFVAWTILPYWTTNAFYAVSPFLARNRRELDTLGLRLLSVQLLAVTCFLLWPLAFSFERPATAGLFGAMFDALTSFDRPYNQAPSLHIALTVVLWAHYAKFLHGFWRRVLDAWFALVCVSILTTFQHHFIDLPTGIAAGWLCVWLWPERADAPWRNARWTDAPERRRLAALYLLGALACAALAVLFGGVLLWAWWPALSLLLVAWHYAFTGAAGFQKRADGRLSMASRWLHAPYLLGARINAWWWTRRAPAPVKVVDGVWLGGLQSKGGRDGFAVVDVCAELSLPGGAQPGDAIVPMLDLATPSLSSVLAAADAIETLRRADERVLVCCALGYSRSALTIAAWLLRSGRSASVDAAIARVRAARPEIVLRPRHVAVLEAVAATGIQGSKAMR